MPQVYDGASNALLSTVCGASAVTVEGNSNSMKVVFTSDGSVTGKGWRASWESE